ncbi:MAG: hypothetical protein KGO96_07155 [Elusimicrobia bacterium]|nr:hypothetical protein [Elusimicrobiota bacterium]
MTLQEAKEIAANEAARLASLHAEMEAARAKLAEAKKVTAEENKVNLVRDAQAKVAVMTAEAEKKAAEILANAKISADSLLARTRAACAGILDRANKGLNPQTVQRKVVGVIRYRIMPDGSKVRLGRGRPGLDWVIEEETPAGMPVASPSAPVTVDAAFAAASAGQPIAEPVKVASAGEAARHLAETGEPVEFTIG